MRKIRFVVPNFFTSVNFLMGVFAILLATGGLVPAETGIVVGAQLVLIGALADGKIPVVAASGLAGFGKSNDIRVRKAGKNLYLVGDLVSGISPELAPASPRVGIAAAMEANTVVAILLGMEI